MEKEIKIKVGNKVLLKNKRGEKWNPEGDMDKWIGKVVTVSKVIFDFMFEIEEDHDNARMGLFLGNKWVFDIDDIERIVYGEFGPKDLQFGDIVTTKNGNRYVVAADRMYANELPDLMDGSIIHHWYHNDLTIDEDDETYKEKYDIMKIERAEEVIWERFEDAKEPAREMTLEEIKEALGFDVKVVEK